MPEAQLDKLYRFRPPSLLPASGGRDVYAARQRLRRLKRPGQCARRSGIVNSRRFDRAIVDEGIVW